MRLRNQDWKSLFDAIVALHSDHDPSTIGERALAAVNQVIACDITAYDFFQNDGLLTGEYWSDPPEAIGEKEYEILNHVIHEHPFAGRVFGGGERGLFATSDHMTALEFSHTAIYSEYYKLFDIDHQLVTARQLGENEVVTCAFNRSSMGFTAEERTMLDLLSPHLVSAVRNSRKLEAVIELERTIGSALGHRSIGMIRLDSSLRVRHVNRVAEDLLLSFFGSIPGSAGSLPDFLRSWISNQQNSRKEWTDNMGIFRVSSANASLEISVIKGGKDQDLFILLEEFCSPVPEQLKQLGLTKRQSEVLHFVALGKTDKDIGELLGISYRTVQKHLESIYRRLGVETRVAAAQRANEHYGTRHH